MSGGPWLAAALVAATAVACGPPPPTPAPATLAALAAGSGEPPRPILADTADTNDALAYYRYARFNVELGANLDSADLALYWAARLDPTWADPLATRAAAIVRAHRAALLNAAVRRRRVDPALPLERARVVDSLLHEALGRTPFLRQPPDLTVTWGFSPRRLGPAGQGRLAFEREDFEEAAKRFGEALVRHPDSLSFRVYRAHAFYFLTWYDSTVTEMRIVLDSARAREQKELVLLYPSKELIEYALAVALIQREKWVEAREALQRALLENAGFYWARVRLAGVALGLNDTATAVEELESAVQLGPGDPALRFYYGWVLRIAGQSVSAIAELSEAVRLDPHFANAHAELAIVYDGLGRAPEAVEHYRAFLARASRRNTMRAHAQQRVATLGKPPP
ncbi:MAG TPA: tetratricopeptide repeat protein [Gemmatimonadales bacterium]